MNISNYNKCGCGLCPVCVYIDAIIRLYALLCSQPFCSPSSSILASGLCGRGSSLTRLVMNTQCGLFVGHSVSALSLHESRKQWISLRTHPHDFFCPFRVCFSLHRVRAAWHRAAGIRETWFNLLSLRNRVQLSMGKGLGLFCSLGRVWVVPLSATGIHQCICCSWDNCVKLYFN